MKARLNRPNSRTQASPGKEEAERRGQAKRARRAREPERKESAAFSLGWLAFAAAAGWARARFLLLAALRGLATWAPEP